MRESVAGISIFQLVILFILLFTGIMCLTINQSKAFGVKDEIITIIENNSYNNRSLDSLDEEMLALIVDKMNDVGYRNTGKCPDGYMGYDRNQNHNNNNAAFCVKVYSADEAFVRDLETKCSGGKCIPLSATGSESDYPKMYYYSIVLFYQLNVPVLSEAMNFKTYASTRLLK